MKVCEECGMEVDENVSVCPNCGCPLEEEINAPVSMDSGEVNPMEHKHMGALVHCPECGQDTYSEDEFCEHCGFPVREHYNKLNKRKLSDVIDDFSFQSVKDYFDYVIHEARNTIKIVAGALVMMLFFVVVTLCGSISNAGKRADAKEKYNVAHTQAVKYDNDSMQSIADACDVLVTKYTTKMVVDMVVCVVLVGLMVVSIRILIKDYNE